MSKHLLVPVDDSDRAFEALEYALEEYPDGTITALHVVDPTDTYLAGGEGAAMATYEDVRDHQEERSERILQRARDLAAERDVTIETEEVIGSVARSVVDYAEEADVDHVVIGSHGRSGVSRILLGSVAETVARRAPVPVTIVR